MQAQNPDSKQFVLMASLDAYVGNRTVHDSLLFQFGSLLTLGWEVYHGPYRMSVGAGLLRVLHISYVILGHYPRWLGYTYVA